MKRFFAAAFGLLALAVTAQATAGTVLFRDKFESGDLSKTGTVVSAFWEARPGLPTGVVEVSDDDGVQHSRPYGVRLGQTTDKVQTENALDLHIDLSGEDQVELSFWISSNQDETNAGEGIWYSDDGGATFTLVFAFDPSNWNQRRYGRFPPLDVDRLAAENDLALTADFVIRFQQQGVDDFDGPNTSFRDGIFLDDVVVRAAPEFYSPLPFGPDSFETGKLQSPWNWGDSRFSNPGRAAPRRNRESHLQ